MKLILILLLIARGNDIFSQEIISESYIIWNKDRKLTYSDFKLKVESDSTRKINITYKDSITGRVFDTAVTSFMSSDTNVIRVNTSESINFENGSSVDIGYEYHQINENSVHYKIFAYFWSERSRMKNKRTDVLHHEQIHFDVYELYARLLKKYLITNLRKSNFISIDEIISQYKQKAIEMNEWFDIEAFNDLSENGNANKSNTKWEKQIYDQIKALDKYAKLDGIIILK